MSFYRSTILCLCLLFSLPLIADTSYQTAPKPQSTEKPQEWQVPVLSVDPVTQKTRVYLQPDVSLGNGLASHESPVYHARTLYEPTETGISNSLVELHRQMANRCPRGWIKRQEWANLQSDTPELHYQFQCLSMNFPKE